MQEATSILDGIIFNPESSLSTIQSKSDVLNNIVTGLITTLVIANIGSIVNRLVALSKKDSFSLRSYTRAFLYANSDDPLLLFSWLRGRYDFRVEDGSHSELQVRNKRLILPLLARCIILMVSIGSIAIALPSEQVVDACSGGDFAVYQEPLKNLPQPSPLRLNQLCIPLSMESRLGTVRSTLSKCTTFFPAVNVSQLSSILDITKGVESRFAFIQAAYAPNSGALLTAMFSRGNIILVGTWIEWRLSNGDVFWSTITDYNPTIHLDILTGAVRRAANSSCETVHSSTPIFEFSKDGHIRQLRVFNCSFNPEEVVYHAIESVTRSLHFREQNELALRLRFSSNELDRLCAAEVTITRPLMNIVPLSIAAAVSFALNKIIAAVLTSRADVTHLGFHIVRELFGHDTSANPLQQGTAQEPDESVPIRRYVCADGVSAHVGFIEGEGDEEVQQFDDNTQVACCSQITSGCRHFVKTSGPHKTSAAKKGNDDDDGGV